MPMHFVAFSTSIAIAFVKMGSTLKRFKYESEIRTTKNCPPEECCEKNCWLYRFVHNPIRAADDFLPVRLLDSSRDGIDCCAGWALSMFDSEPAAKQRYVGLRKKYRNFSKKAGTHLAAADISASDGVCSPADKAGHVSFYEYAGVDLGGKFTIVCALVKEAG